jgi:hypothetical protein
MSMHKVDLMGWGVGWRDVGEMAEGVGREEKEA